MSVLEVTSLEKLLQHFFLFRRDKDTKNMFERIAKYQFDLSAVCFMILFSTSVTKEMRSCLFEAITKYKSKTPITTTTTKKAITVPHPSLSALFLALKYVMTQGFTPLKQMEDNKLKTQKNWKVSWKLLSKFFPHPQTQRWNKTCFLALKNSWSRRVWIFWKELLYKFWLPFRVSKHFVEQRFCWNHHWYSVDFKRRE